jgi:DNA-directed RNA polymerase III subunit RPC1
MGTEGVDGRETKTNHVMEVQTTLGIEAARKTIM